MFEIVARELRAKLLGRRRGLTGQRADAPSHTSATRRRRCGGRRRVRRAWLRRPWEAAGPGQASRRRAEPHISDQAPPVWRAPEGPEGTAAVPVGGGRARLRRPWAAAGPEQAHAPQAPPDWRPPRGLRGLAGLRDDAPSGARGADGERAGRRPRAHQAARPDESGPTAPGTPAARQTALTLRRRARGVPCS